MSGGHCAPAGQVDPDRRYSALVIEVGILPAAALVQPCEDLLEAGSLPWIVLAAGLDHARDLSRERGGLVRLVWHDVSLENGLKNEC